MSDPFRVITQTESWAGIVQDDVVDCLLNLLSMAEAGELQGFAYAALMADNSTASGFTRNNDLSAMIGGLERVKHRMISGE